MRHKMPGVDAWGNCCRCGQEVRHSGGCDCCSHEMYVIPPQKDTKAPTRQNNIYEKFFVDITPNEELPVRILEAYVDESFSSDNTSGLTHENPLIIEMEKARKERNRILRDAIDVLLRKDSRG